MDLSVIIINYNTGDLLADCIRSVTGAARGLATEVWVVDNASSDGSPDLVRSRFPDVHLLTNPENLGFARANNQALARARGRYCLLLNPDTIVSEDTLHHLVAFMDESQHVGAVGCAQFWPNGERQLTAHRRPTLTRETLLAFGLARMLPWLVEYSPRQLSTTPRPVDWVEGGALLLRRPALESIGLMDDQFFMYVEDIDLCIRLWRAGWPVYYLPNVTIIHHRGQATGLEQRPGRSQRINTDLLLARYRSKAYFMRKHLGQRQADIFCLLARLYAIRKLAMEWGAHLIGQTEDERWHTARLAYSRLLTASLVMERIADNDVSS